MDTLDLLDLLRYTCFTLWPTLVLSRRVESSLRRALRLSALISTISIRDPRARVCIPQTAPSCCSDGMPAYEPAARGSIWRVLGARANRVAIAQRSLISPAFRQSDLTLSLPRPGVRHRHIAAPACSARSASAHVRACFPRCCHGVKRSAVYAHAAGDPALVQRRRDEAKARAVPLNSGAHAVGFSSPSTDRSNYSVRTYRQTVYQASSIRRDQVARLQTELVSRNCRHFA